MPGLPRARTQLVKSTFRYAPKFPTPSYIKEDARRLYLIAVIDATFVPYTDGENRPTLQRPFRTRDVSSVLRQDTWFWRRGSSDNRLVGQGGVPFCPTFIDEENFSDISAKTIKIWDTDVSICYLFCGAGSSISLVSSRPRLRSHRQ